MQMSFGGGGSPESFVAQFEDQLDDALLSLEPKGPAAGRVAWALNKLDGNLWARLFPKGAARKVGLFFTNVRRSSGPGEEWETAMLIEGLALVRMMELRNLLRPGTYAGYRGRVANHFGIR